MGVVTISAAYGAGGSEIGPAVGKELDLPFIDRAISTEVAAKLGVTVDDVDEREDRVEGRFWRVLCSMAIVPDPSGANPLGAYGIGDEREFRNETEHVLRGIAASGGGVILGRAAAIVLADAPAALHVRLHGPAKARADAHAGRTGITRQAAMDELRRNDGARENYVKHLYRCDATQSRHYHLVVDTTVLPWDAVAELIVVAARAKGVVPPS